MSSSLDSRQEIQRRRTFAIISHPDAGKTTLTEKLLFHGGVIHKTGEVKGKAGTQGAKSDWMTLEREKGISITSSVMQFDFEGLRVNLLDTPGHKDFSEDTYRTLVAADSACMLIDVAKGVEERTQKLYDVCRYRNIPIFTFINKLDREGKAPLELIDEVENTLRMQCYPVSWPIGIGQRFCGVYKRASKEVVLYDQRRERQEDLVFKVDSFDDERVREKVPSEIFEQCKEEIELLDVALPPFDREAFLKGEISPVTFGSAKQNFGVETFLKFFHQYAPAPAPRKSKDSVVDPLDKNFSGFVFKIQANMDKNHRDRVAFLRICSGKFERGIKVKHSRLNRELRLSFSNQFLAGDRETVDEAFAGDIVGLSDSGHFQIGDSISTGKPPMFEDIPNFPPELFAKLSVSDAMKRQKLQKGIKQLAEEGTIQLFIDPYVGIQDPIIGVVGELQFDVLLFRLEDEYGLDVKLQRQSFTVAKWPRSEDGKAVSDVKGVVTVYRDLHDKPVVLLEREWDVNWLQKENPDLHFGTSIEVAR